ncbi:hypothetical protein ACOTEY_14395 [Achromobacter xylosoxidans]
MVDPKSYGLHCKAPAMPPKKTDAGHKPAQPLPNEDHDGYALRLAIEHHISIKQQYGRVTAKGKFSATVSFRDCGGDRYAATRLAIFRAAGIVEGNAT